MAHKNDPDYQPGGPDSGKPDHAPSKKSLKESHEKAHGLIQGSKLKLNSVEGPASRIEPFSSFSVKCPHGHDHVISVDHSTGKACVYNAGDAEESDADPEHEGDVASALKHLSKKHGAPTSDDDEDAGSSDAVKGFFRTMGEGIEKGAGKKK